MQRSQTWKNKEGLIFLILTAIVATQIAGYHFLVNNIGELRVIDLGVIELHLLKVIGTLAGSTIIGGTTLLVLFAIRNEKRGVIANFLALGSCLVAMGAFVDEIYPHTVEGVLSHYTIWSLLWYTAEFASFWGIILIGWAFYTYMSIFVIEKRKQLHIALLTLTIGAYALLSSVISIWILWTPIWGIMFGLGVAVSHVGLGISVLPLEEWEPKRRSIRVAITVVVFYGCAALGYEAYKSIQEHGFEIDPFLVIGILTCLLTIRQYKLTVRLTKIGPVWQVPKPPKHKRK